VSGAFPNQTVANAGIVSLSAGAGIGAITGTNPATIGIAAGGVGQTQVANGYVDLSSTQAAINGSKVFNNNVQVNGSFAVGGTSQSGNAGDVTITRSGFNSGYIFYGTSGTHYSGFDGTNFLWNGANGTFSGSLTSGGSLFIGSAPKTGLAAGDINAERSASTGVLFLGGNTSAGAWDYGITNAGNFTANASIYATNFFAGSRREWKKNITAYTFDPVAVLEGVDYAEYDCKDPRCGPSGMHKVGLIANDSPWQVAGRAHDHYDAFAMAAIDGAAIVKQQKQIKTLMFVLHALCQQPQNRGIAECAALSQ
jgi:hypothetical protein